MTTSNDVPSALRPVLEALHAAWLIEGMESALNRLMAAAVAAAKEIPNDNE